MDNCLNGKTQAAPLSGNSVFTEFLKVADTSPESGRNVFRMEGAVLIFCLSWSAKDGKKHNIYKDEMDRFILAIGNGFAMADDLIGPLATLLKAVCSFLLQRKQYIFIYMNNIQRGITNIS